MTMRDFFVRRREVWQLTWHARLLLLALLAGVATVLLRGVGGFLAVNEPVQGRYLVVEGWMPAFAYQYASEVYRRGHYERVISAGAVPDFALSNGRPREFAAVGSLVAAGVPGAAIVEAMGAPVHQDRTYHSAVNVRRWLESQGITSSSVDVITLGPHARRSRLLFEAALGPDVTVGVYAVPDPRYDLAHWWRSSEGVRSVLGETIAYVYARLFFDPRDLG
jgi:hypothetical protein